MENIKNKERDFYKLEKYTIWYYDRFSPSLKKLEEKISEKCDDEKIIKQVLKSISPLLREQEILRHLMTEMLKKGKNQKWIIVKLLAKWFKKDDIDKIFFELEKDEWLKNSEESYLKTKIAYKSQTKSINAIMQSLIISWVDRTKALKAISWLENSKESVEKNIGILKWKWFSKQEIIEKMMRKWFKYRDFKELI